MLQCCKSSIKGNLTRANCIQCKMTKQLKEGSFFSKSGKIIWSTQAMSTAKIKAKKKGCKPVADEPKHGPFFLSLVALCGFDKNPRWLELFSVKDQSCLGM